MATNVVGPGLNGFGSDSWTADGVSSPIPITYIYMPFKSWRLSSLLITLWYFIVITILLYQITNILLILTFLLLLWALVRSVAMLCQKCGIGDGQFGKSPFTTAERLLVVFILRQVSGIARKTGTDTIWKYFWTLYFFLSIRRGNMMQNYMEAWRQNNADYYMVMFVDHDEYTKIPCPDPTTLNDRDLMIHLDFFYRVTRVQRSITQALLPKDLIRVDIVDFENNFTAGRHRSTIDLGYRKYRQIGYLVDPSSVLLARTRFIDKFREENVIQAVIADGGNPPLPVISGSGASGTAGQARALSFVSGWNAFLASVIIVTPTVLSVIICIAWPMVAVLKYDADVQTSIQTDTTLASYIVTAGALLIALITWYDTITSVKEPHTE